jgi:hypothetical protein
LSIEWCSGDDFQKFWLKVLVVKETIIPSFLALMLLTIPSGLSPLVIENHDIG